MEYSPKKMQQNLDEKNFGIRHEFFLTSMEYNEKIKAIKDTAAGAVSLVAIGSVVVGIAIFMPKILALLNWL